MSVCPSVHPSPGPAWAAPSTLPVAVRDTQQGHPPHLRASLAAPHGPQLRFLSLLFPTGNGSFRGHLSSPLWDSLIVHAAQGRPSLPPLVGSRETCGMSSPVCMYLYVHSRCPETHGFLWAPTGSYGLALGIFFQTESVAALRPRPQIQVCHFTVPRNLMYTQTQTVLF